jgi:hypothetical protein
LISRINAVRLFAGPFFLLFEGFSCFVAGGAFLQGVFEKNGVLRWCFCGEVEVVCCESWCVDGRFLASKNLPLF